MKSYWKGNGYFAVLIASSAALSGCTAHESFNRTSDYDAVVTVKDPDYDFSKNRTYAVVAEVADLSDLTSNPIEIKDMEKWSNVIKDGIHRNMRAAGYTEFDGETADADVVVAAGIVATESWTYYGYYPWWGWGGWYYYPGAIAVDYSSGSVILVMIDPKRTAVLPGADDPADAGADGGIGGEVYQAVWGAGLRALLSRVTEQKVSDGIDQAFQQSAYLNLNGGDK